ncbi:hypothetical protein [Paraliomyxa miuraensis]|uniref:hypothetical protein n=1 Tax=Paraliomyxa miuraensis TaxID=376150 RepID=UPI002256F108|nr:hypothetical protein [Paraliomyxa miuraensis]MCX4246069.1 hypothetical protein [Paraliomyxa miuraensis]
MRNVAIYVEGYHDRAFLKGWLLHRGWQVPGRRKSGRKHAIVNPVTEKEVEGGRFAFSSPHDSTFLELRPMHGDDLLLNEIGRLARRVTPPDPDEIVVVLDVDVDGTQLADGIARREQSVNARLLSGDPGTTRSGSSWALSSGVLVHLALWTCESEDCRGVPDAHTLERLVSTAIKSVHPERAEAVQAWLDARPAPPPRRTAKEHSWSYMAGWYADLGCDAFLSNVWDDPEIAAALENSLSTSGLDAILRGYEQTREQIGEQIGE